MPQLKSSKRVNFPCWCVAGARTASLEVSGMSWQNLQTAEFLEVRVRAICYINFYTSDWFPVVVSDVELTAF
jgi:hypothetical protein